MSSELLMRMILRHKPRSNEIKQLPYLEDSIISRVRYPMTYPADHCCSDEGNEGFAENVERHYFR